jgi:hypothetical protein
MVENEKIIEFIVPKLKAIHIHSRSSQSTTKTVKEYVLPMLNSELIQTLENQTEREKHYAQHCIKIIAV